MQPLTSFGSNGWLSGTSFGAAGTNGSIRSIAFNAATGNVIVANGSALQVVNGTTGAIGATLNATGITGGSRALSAVTVTTDGVIYGANLTTSSTSSAFKIYRWANESAVPTTFYSGNAGYSLGVRAGDSLTSVGADATGMLAFGTGTATGAPVPTNYYSLLTTNGGVAGTVFAMTGTGAANLSFRTGLAFIDEDTVLGLGAGSTTNNALVSGFSGSWTFDGLRTIRNVNERSMMAAATIFGTPMLATVQFGGNGGTLLTSTNAVRLYDLTNVATSGLGTPLASGNIAVGAVTNGNGNVGVAFGTVSSNPVVFAMNANNGIQAFQIVPEPTTTLAVGICTVGLAVMTLRRRHDHNQ
ncbi:MAG: hypothetical protein ACKO40_13140 [Planctomycetaceae bacterium]